MYNALKVYAINVGNIQAAALQAERAAKAENSRDPESGFTLHDINEWMRSVADGEQDAHPVAQKMAQGWGERENENGGSTNDRLCCVPLEHF